MVLRGFVGSVVCLSLLASACKDSQKPQESAKPAPQATAIAPPAPPALQFTDVTATAGVAFHHESGATGKKWYPETMGAGGGFFDYDGDGWPDILLVNGRRWPGEGGPLSWPPSAHAVAGNAALLS
jgi:enediyne biosynthesis protein E4